MITYWLIAVNVILYVVPILFGLYDDLIANYSIWGPAIREGQTYRLFTGIFYMVVFYIYYLTVMRCMLLGHRSRIF